MNREQAKHVRRKNKVVLRQPIFGVVESEQKEPADFGKYMTISTEGISFTDTIVRASPSFTILRAQIGNMHFDFTQSTMNPELILEGEQSYERTPMKSYE